MFIFKKQRDESNEFDTTTVTIESNAVSLPDILSDFKDFLMASGYVISPEDTLIIYKDGELE